MSKYYLDRTRIDLEDDNELNLGDPDIIPRTKPLRWRTGPIREDGRSKFLVRRIDCNGEIYYDLTHFDPNVREGYDPAVAWLPLSEILALVEG